MTTATLAHLDPNRRHDFVLLFDVQDGNPNGDPDAGNLPRVDPETMQGLVTDVCLKRKIRDYVDVVKMGEAPYKIYVQMGSYLTDTRARVFENHSIASGTHPLEAQHWMCAEFYDIRMFGAVMSMGTYAAGQVNGPMQMTFARSIDPVLPSDVTIARVALERRDEVKEEAGDVDGAEDAGVDDDPPTHGTLGRKALVPYGLYRGYGFFNPHRAKQTGISAEDLKLFWSALIHTWDLDRSAARGLMACRGLYVFSHESSLGNAPAHRLFDLVSVRRQEGAGVARSFRDHVVSIDEAGIPEKVQLTRLEG